MFSLIERLTSLNSTPPFRRISRLKNHGKRPLENPQTPDILGFVRVVAIILYGHSSTSLKLKLSRGNVKAVQGDTGHAEAWMVMDTYAHGFDADRKLIAQEMDSGFFSKVGAENKQAKPDAETVAMLKKLIQEHSELLSELLK